MRAPRITAENLTNQVAVVSEEIRLNVLNRPYGGFPWIQLPALMFDTFANAHNGYGDFVDLQAATVADCAEFFETYYTPANAVLTVCGDFDVDEADRAGRPAFRRRPAPARAGPAVLRTSRGRTVVREAEHIDQHAPSPALAVGWRLPDPVADLPGYLSFVVLGQHPSRRRIVPAAVRGHRESRSGDGYLGQSRVCSVARWIPGTRTCSCSARSTHAFGPGVDGDRRRRRADRGAGRRRPRRSGGAAGGGAGSPPRSTGTTTVSPAGPGRSASLELLHGRAELLSELPDLLSAVTGEQIAAAARSLDPGPLRRAARRPGAGSLMAAKNSRGQPPAAPPRRSAGATAGPRPVPALNPTTRVRTPAARPGRTGQRPDGDRRPQAAQPAGRGAAAGAVRRHHPAAQRPGRDAGRDPAARHRFRGPANRSTPTWRWSAGIWTPPSTRSD